ncbi:alkyl hydroperoxide reductase AhpD [Zafaria cholistanensis]|uniref:Alkyl hydroperoxide reductase AhpD n=1 Tax=Zafaria cholistanensis TaxID=1682741 RepID=A0A5A7NSN9_9MICC|nr:carboxymuconolactone decarboxylase family protein [Zafaria cholistanensis]GER23790.1 alkyl hydroperoxide reductase AhpD [Zafaria cholistanensis]
MGSADAFYLDKSDPAAWKALNALSLKVGAALKAAGIGPRTIELVNLRISQINGCAYCLDMHTKVALEAGESIQRLGVLPVWREAGLFSDEEMAALAVAEMVTVLPHEEDRLAELAGARNILTDAQYSALTWAAISINAFNRVSILSRHAITPDPEAKQA